MNMRLHDEQWGSGDRIAQLLHGMMGSAESWWRLAPEIAIGHSFGGMVLATAVPRLQPARAVQVDTATAIAAAIGGDWTPAAPPASLTIRAYPSDYVSDETVTRLRAGGIDVRQIAGAANSVWYSHFDEFLETLDVWTASDTPAS